MNLAKTAGDTILKSPEPSGIPRFVNIVLPRMIMTAEAVLCILAGAEYWEIQLPAALRTAATAAGYAKIDPVPALILTAATHIAGRVIMTILERLFKPLIEAQTQAVIEQTRAEEQAQAQAVVEQTRAEEQAQAQAAVEQTRAEEQAQAQAAVEQTRAEEQAQAQAAVEQTRAEEQARFDLEFQAWKKRQIDAGATLVDDPGPGETPGPEPGQ